MTTHTRRVIMCVMVSGLLLAACSATSSTQKAPKSQRQLETTACKLISVPPKPSTGTDSFEAISMPISTLSALKKTGDSSLQNVVRDFDAAASAQNTVAMIRALTNGVKVCHGLGLKTAT
jgi:lipopolysaccharide export LptBFGC system permease protein LptF